PQYAFGWQGGEPTLMGLDFFKAVTRLQIQHGKKGAVVANSLQTNALLLDDDWARHLGEYKFLLGVSLDGPAELHDTYRRTRGGQGTHAEVLKALACLRRRQVEFNALVLVNAVNVHKPRDVFRFLCEQGIAFHQYVPCVEFDPQGKLLPYAITGEQWGEFLCGLFDEWRKVDPRQVSIRLWDSILSKLVENKPTICHMEDNCCQYFVVEHNGDVYPCDFFVQSELKLGNIQTHTWREFGQSEAYRSFGRQKSQLNAACRACPWFRFCAGDCLKHRLPLQSDPRTLSWLCEGWKRFYKHALPDLEVLARQIVAERRLPPAPMAPSAPPGRNAPCPCGSGKKFKHCHGA
ncbi:MAG: SPASM domain-containing protein, partial [Lentisphaerae bacterium]|nr:SPASM domain-containing protein [Lentisphaerota bacterium]